VLSADDVDLASTLFITLNNGDYDNYLISVVGAVLPPYQGFLTDIRRNMAQMQRDFDMRGLSILFVVKLIILGI
jgi:hypothetical protein